MHLTQTDLVSTSFVRHRLIEHCMPLLELVVSLNSNDAQIYNKQGAEWVPTVTLSEVRVLLPGQHVSIHLWNPPARQIDYFRRLGP